MKYGARDTFPFLGIDFRALISSLDNQIEPRVTALAVSSGLMVPLVSTFNCMDKHKQVTMGGLIYNMNLGLHTFKKGQVQMSFTSEFFTGALCQGPKANCESHGLLSTVTPMQEL